MQFFRITSISARSSIDWPVMLFAYRQLKSDLEKIRDANHREAEANPQIGRLIATHLNPPADENGVYAFEARHGVQLPSEYRQFLTTIANGGVGPGSGLERLGQFGGTDWRDTPGLIGELSAPFPYTSKWNANPIDGSRPIEEQYQQQDQYWDSQHVRGAIPICDLGCGLRQLLIVTGPERGHIWFDDRADWQGMYPLTDGNGHRLNFFEWYRSWADTRLEAIDHLQE